MQTIPRPALLLGLAGLIPFLWGALTVALPDLAAWGRSALGPRFIGPYIQVFYGAIILAFMSGVLWGFATRGTGWSGYALSVLPALWAFFTTGGGAERAGAALIVGFLGLLALEGDRVVKERDLKGGEAETTNNRMELLAAISALESLTRPSAITIVTDSAYVKNGVTQWIHGWKRNGWKTSAKKPVKNVDLWQRLGAAQARHDVTWEWVKGHAGHPENERADELARAGMAPFKPG